MLEPVVKNNDPSYPKTLFLLKDISPRRDCTSRSSLRSLCCQHQITFHSRKKFACLRNVAELHLDWPSVRLRLGASRFPALRPDHRVPHERLLPRESYRDILATAVAVRRHQRVIIEVANLHVDRRRPGKRVGRLPILLKPSRKPSSSSGSRISQDSRVTCRIIDVKQYTNRVGFVRNTTLRL